jgi:ribonuclease P/MRP protein subunit POP5
MAKLKPIIPTLREKKRYLAFEILSKSKIKASASVSKAISHGMLSFVGAKGAAEAGIAILHEKYNDQNQKGIVRVNHKQVDALKASLTTIQDIDAVPVSIRSVGVSGSLKKATTYVAG